MLDAVFEALQPAGIEATLRAIELGSSDHQARVRSAELELERAQIHAERARRQFDACEPENRLVARTLEREWEQRLTEIRRGERDLAQVATKRRDPLTDEEIAWCRRAGADLRAVFRRTTGQPPPATPNPAGITNKAPNPIPDVNITNPRSRHEIRLRSTRLHESRSCSSEGCRCRRGELHGPYTYLAVYLAGRSRIVYVPKALADLAAEHVELTQRNEALLGEISQVNLELLRRRALE